MPDPGAPGHVQDGSRVEPVAAPPRVEYEISALGRSLGPLFAHLAEWAAASLGQIEAARRNYDEAGSPRG